MRMRSQLLQAAANHREVLFAGLDSGFWTGLDSGFWTGLWTGLLVLAGGPRKQNQEPGASL